MQFCPSCSNMLLVENGVGKNGESCLVCQTCPYMFPISATLVTRTILKRKEVDDVLGGEEAWRGVETVEAMCEKCGHDKAYFMQLQIRSADEPMTLFYRCCNSSCSNVWKEN
ncbi:RNA polymerase III C11 subunit [Coemansia sp. Benny D160-2]|nr:RNA polymerase III C11 subunit [Coemansia sp. Benny D160-2]KAJ2617567.1 RNA polymerase III C11 subunit [Coemansia sp. RSA 1804]KAJ2688781.1 RNA polymerase III C11 subunit [Coemansia sp. RSA 1285]